MESLSWGNRSFCYNITFIDCVCLSLALLTFGLYLRCERVYEASRCNTMPTGGSLALDRSIPVRRLSSHLQIKTLETTPSHHID